MSSWKQDHANKSEKAIGHELVQSVINEFKFNLRLNPEVGPDDALWDYGLMKICNAVAQVARAQALGFNPNILKMSDSEIGETRLRLIKIAVKTGKPVIVLQIQEQSGQ